VSDADAQAASDTSREDAAVSILTSGTPIRCLARLPTALVEESTLHFDADGLHLQAVDPANVGMIEVTAHADGFEAYRCADELDLTIATSLDRLQSVLSWARMRGDGDPVTLDVFTDPDRIRVTITRPDQGLNRSTEWFGLDPESIRAEPDVPDLDLPCVATPDVDGFRDAVTAFANDHAAVEYDGKGALVLVDDRSDDVTERFTFPDAAWVAEDTAEAEAVGTSSLFSLDYLEDMAGAIAKSRAEKCTVRWGEQYPVFMQFEHPEWGFEGRFALAPRRKKDDEDDES
jgi:proliferating cell nuclear antigen